MFTSRLEVALHLYEGHASAMHSASALIATASRGEHAKSAREELPDREEKTKVSILGGDFRNVNLGDIPLKFLCLNLSQVQEQCSYFPSMRIFK